MIINFDLLKLKRNIHLNKIQTPILKHIFCLFIALRLHIQPPFNFPVDLNDEAFSEQQITAQCERNSK